MTQTLRLTALGALLLAPLAFPLTALAQETTAPATTAPATTAPADTAAPADAQAPAAPAAPAADANAQPQAPQMVVKNTYGDWQLRCLQTADGSDPCEIFQLLKDEKGAPVAQASFITLPETEKAALGATITAPLETFLPAGLGLTLDAQKPKAYPFTFCNEIGCSARVGFTADEYAALKKGNKMVVAVVPMLAPDKTVTVTMSLKGFTDATDALKKEMAGAKSN